MTIHIFIDLFYGSVTVRQLLSFLGTLVAAVLLKRSRENWPLNWPLLLLPRAVWRLSQRSLGSGSILYKADICNKSDGLCLKVPASSNCKFAYCQLGYKWLKLHEVNLSSGCLIFSPLMLLYYLASATISSSASENRNISGKN